MLKRVLIDVQRHAVFFDLLLKGLPELGKTEARSRKRPVPEELKNYTYQGDALWKWNDPSHSYIAVEIFTINNNNVTSKVVPYGMFISAIRETITDLSWVQQIVTSDPSEWPYHIPSFLFTILCQQPWFSKAIKMDPESSNIISIGRYIFLQHWKNANQQNNGNFALFLGAHRLPQHLATLPSVIVKMVFWYLISTKVPQNHVLRYTGMLEKTLEDPRWWETLPNPDVVAEDKIIVEKLLEKLADPSTEEIARWTTFFNGLPEMLEYFYYKPKTSKNSKIKIFETSTVTLIIEDAKNMLIRDQMWGQYKTVVDFEKSG
jgi:hypothetical protein